MNILHKRLNISGNSVNPNNSLVRRALFFTIYLVFGIFIAFISLAIVSLFFRISLNGFFQSLTTEVVVEAIKLSILTSFFSLIIVIVLGTPIAYINARYRYLGKQLVDTLIDIPVVLPPAVAGLGLLMAFGRRGLVGQYLSAFGFDIAFTTLAVIMAQVFVSSPFYIRQAKTSFEDVNSEFEAAARTLGATPLGVFFRITVPIAMNGLVSGAIMAWARALGEFGATVMFAGNFQGRTQTMPLAIYSALESNLDAAISLAIILVIVSFIIIAVIKSLTGITFFAPVSDRT
ncbi:MAG TPA: ABC transporter permease [Candidatus Bathyarchaeia archaeon]|nr:ABC transporter permease [Candidatus Bathyarchaeia archaeon]